MFAFFSHVQTLRAAGLPRQEGLIPEARNPEIYILVRIPPGIWRERYVCMPLMEEDLNNRNDRIFWDGWKSINYLETKDLARRACGELGVCCSPWTTHGCWISACIRFEPAETKPSTASSLRHVTLSTDASSSRHVTPARTQSRVRFFQIGNL